ncbi:MAG: ABC transporter permease [Brevirhabdus sp.]
MTSPIFSRIALGLYFVIFFSYLMGPLVVMSLSAFNSPGFPSVSPWDCFTFEWFAVLWNDTHIREGIYYSVIIGFGTVILAVSMGLAASIVLTQITPRLRSVYYTLIIAPILIPGVVIGISTLVFWDRVGHFLGAGEGSLLDGLFHNGLFLTILGQSSFIASYAMLVFVARLQRFDPGLTEAALDLGASHTQAFRKILLPFLRPAIASASVLAFLASFENYNTTTFTIVDYKTLTTVLAQKVRLGINPSISALAFSIITLTVLAALASEAYRRAAARKESIRKGVIASQPKARLVPSWLRGNPAAIILVLVCFAIITAFGVAQRYSPDQCKIAVREAKQAEIQRRVEELRARRQQEAATETPAPAPDQGTDAPPSSNGAFGNVFAPGNLPGAPTTSEDQPAEEPQAPASGAFGNVFAPGNLSTGEGD